MTNPIPRTGSGIPGTTIDPDVLPTFQLPLTLSAISSPIPLLAQTHQVTPSPPTQYEAEITWGGFKYKITQELSVSREVWNSYVKGYEAALAELKTKGIYPGCKSLDLIAKQQEGIEATSSGTKVMLNSAEMKNFAEAQTKGTLFAPAATASTATSNASPSASASSSTSTPAPTSVAAPAKPPTEQILQKPPVGIQNGSNNCFINAAVQALLVDEGVNEWLDRDISNDLDSEKKKLHGILNEIRQNYIRAQNAESCKIAPLRKLRTFLMEKLPGEVTANNQVDTAQVMEVVLGYLPQEESLQFSKTIAYSKDKPPSSQHETLSLIQLSPTKDQVRTLKELYSDYEKEESVDDKGIQSTTTREPIHIPNNLRFQIKRFGFDKAKNKTIKDVTTVNIEKTIQIGNETREIRSVICHSGSSVNGGHYIAYIKRPNGWQIINDGTTQDVNQNDIDNLLSGKDPYWTPVIVCYSKEKATAAPVPASAAAPVPASASSSSTSLLPLQSGKDRPQSRGNPVTPPRSSSPARISVASSTSSLSTSPSHTSDSHEDFFNKVSDEESEKLQTARRQRKKPLGDTPIIDDEPAKPPGLVSRIGSAFKRFLPF